MRTDVFATLFAALVPAIAIGCGGSSGAGPIESDTGPGDTGLTDTGPADGGAETTPPDTDVPEVPACDPATLPTDPWNCGSCGHVCKYPNAAGKCVSGACEMGDCAPGFLDLDPAAPGCEYACWPTTPSTEVCDGADNDCNGKIDDVDLCTDAACGACGNKCGARPHANTACNHTGASACDPTNTACILATCDCTGTGACFWDVDGIVANGCEYVCDKTNGGVEICDGLDNDCNGTIDDGLASVTCHGGTKGLCADATHGGTTSCAFGKTICTGADVLTPFTRPELCNGVDDDCNGTADDATTDTGGSCGSSSNYPCKRGTVQCVAGAATCVGAVEPTTELCNGIDDDCNDTIDDAVADPTVDTPCNVPPGAPAGGTTPCKAGTTKCVSGTLVCQGSLGPIASLDACGVDANCDGTLTSQPNLLTDVRNCGACGNDCLVGTVHANWACVSGACQFQGCQSGFYDLTGSFKCSYACTYTSAKEQCNGVDDNCDGRIDEASALVVPSTSAVCGISPGATSPECTAQSVSNPGGVSVACAAGAWKCAFATPGVCNPSCAATPEICDSYDNNCNGLKNENVPSWGSPCASDDGKAPPGDGVCRTTGTFVCAGSSSVACSATKDLTKAGPELCDGVDNDCDGLVDEPFTAKGANAGYFVKPAVTKIGASLWIYSHEASRPSATTVVPGNGDGYWCTASTCTAGIPASPTGVTLDRTPACSVQGKIPWSNVTPIEAEQTCAAMGGRVCATTDWQIACSTKPPSATSCLFGYAPNGAACATPVGGVTATPPAAYPFPIPVATSRWCNLGPTFDFDASLTGDQNGLLVTGSPSLKNCYADWTAFLSNGATNGKIFDVTGNLREITKSATNTYPLLGGTYETLDESGASCSATSYV
jgi:hypothetical protein